MCKKLGVTALVIVGIIFGLNKLDMIWHVKHHFQKAKQELRSQIPTEEKIVRLKDELAKLKPEKKKHLNVIAEETYSIEKLENEIQKAQANLEKWGTDIKTLKASLKDDNAVFVTIGAEKLPREKVQASLARRWEAFKEAEEAVTSQKELLARRKEKLEAAQAKLRTMESKEKEMVAKVQKLELELAKLRDAQMKNDITIDDSQFSKVVKLYQEIEDQIGKEKKVLELQKGIDSDAKIEEALNEKARVEKAMKEMEERFTNERLVEKK